MLNYKNDPLLLGKETANDLIAEKRENVIFLDKENKMLNLFSAFVKRDDFVKKDKLCQPLQKTVYVKVSKKLAGNINTRFDDKKEIIMLLEKYTERRIQTKKAVSEWFNTGVFPLILLRIISKDEKELAGFAKEIEYITDFVHKSRFYYPKNLDELLTPKIVYLTGCSVGDGHIDKTGKRWVLVDGSSKKERLELSKEFIQKLANLTKGLTNKSRIDIRETKCILTINSKIFCRFLNFFFGLPYGKKKEAVLRKPLILNFNKENLEKYFWRGCFDTDGSVNKDGAFNFCSSDNNLREECVNYLKKINIEVRESDFGINIPGEHLSQLTNIGLSHPRKQKEFLELLKRGIKRKNISLRKEGRIDEKLLQIHNLLRFDENYRVRIHRRNLKKSKFSEEDIKRIIKRLFGCELKRTGNLLYLKSKSAYQYLNKNFVLEPYWKPINTREENQLLIEWNEVWN